MRDENESLGPYTVSDPDALSSELAERVFNSKVWSITLDYLSVGEEFRNEPVLSGRPLSPPRSVSSRAGHAQSTTSQIWAVLYTYAGAPADDSLER